MTTPFRKKFILQILDEYEATKLPLDLGLRRFFKKHKQIGSKDRKEIAETVYTIIRMKGLIDYLCKDTLNWGNRLETYLHNRPLQADPTIEDHIKVSFPKFLFHKLKTCFGQEQALALCETLNTKAPTTIRANPLKTTRKALFNSLSAHCPLTLCEQSPYGIYLHEKINLLGLDEYKQGLFEIQDEASQLVSFLVQAKPKDKVLDYCSGAGGKTLAFAPFMQNKGAVYLYDIRESALKQARRRLKKSGIQNVQFCFQTSQLKRLKGKMDWVLLDVPCSGTGTLRRNPDMKWKYNQEMFDRLVREQRMIFEQGLSYLKPQGKLVYATCSILPEENEKQVAYFTKTFHLKQLSLFQSVPKKGKMDGFFAVVFQKL